MDNIHFQLKVLFILSNKILLQTSPPNYIPYLLTVLIACQYNFKHSTSQYESSFIHEMRSLYVVCALVVLHASAIKGDRGDEILK